LGGSNQSAALRLTNAEARELRHTLKAIELGHKPNAIAFEFGKNIAVSTSLALAALTESAPPINLEAQITQGTTAIFPITAKDLDGLHGKQLGDTLRKLQKLWVASDFTLKKQDLLL
jgi:poly(A) polymerase